MKIHIGNNLDWRDFYSKFFDITGQPNEQGWVNFNCVLPTHPHKDTKHKGGINIFTGSYKCWHADCQLEYQIKLGTRGVYLTPAQVLQLLGHTQDEAIEAVVRFKTERADNESPHLDNFTPDWKPLPAGAKEFVEAAQARLQEGTPLVQDYLHSRGLTFETLVASGAGYVPESDGQRECIIFPYYDLRGRLVGIRARSAGGVKGGLADSVAIPWQLQGLAQYDGGTAIIVEGETDTLAMRQALAEAGIPLPVVGVPGSFFKETWARFFVNYTRLIVIPQDDLPSQRLAHKIKRVFRGRRVDIIKLPFAPQDYGKDIADFLKSHSVEELTALLNYNPAGEKFIFGWDDITQEAERPIQWILPGLIERNTISFMYGPPKRARKTWLALALTRALTNQEPWLDVEAWRPMEPMRVAIVEEEGSRIRIARRITKIYTGTTPPQGYLYLIHKAHLMLDDDASVQLLVDRLQPLKPDLIILDPLTEFHLQDENTVEGIRKVFEGVRTLLNLMPQSAIFILHHPSKAGGSLRGSSALTGLADLILSIEPSRDDWKKSTMRIIGRDLDGTKNELELTFDPTTGMHTASGIKLKLGTLRADIIKVLQKAGRPLTVKELMVAMPGTPEWKLRRALRSTDFLVIEGPNRASGYRYTLRKHHS